MRKEKGNKRHYIKLKNIFVFFVLFFLTIIYATDIFDGFFFWPILTKLFGRKFNCSPNQSIQ